MAKREVRTDLWVYKMLKEAGIDLDPQGSSIKEIDNALKSASKKGNGNVGFPEYVGVVKDFLIVIEDKADYSNHLKLDENGLISVQQNDIKNYAVNGALFYGNHLGKNTSYKKIITIGVSGNEKKHRISPVYIDETEFYRELPEIESFISFNEQNIEEYYVREILKEATNQEKETAEILKDAASLHEDLRNYGNLKDVDKPLVVSGILLALRESEFGNFDIDSLKGDSIVTDGEKIFTSIDSNLTRSKVSPQVKKDKILSQFSIIKDTKILNEINKSLGETPLKYYVKFLKEHIYDSIKFSKSSEDYLGRFYGEFMSYSGGDGQALGIILTPKHITDLFCDLVDIQPSDVVFDPCCGTGGFLVASMHHMLEKATTEQEKKNIKQKQLYGFELQPYMFTIATTNMILRGDGKSNLINDNFLTQNPAKLQLYQPTVGMMNPPYSQGSKKNQDLYEIAFAEHLLDSLTVGARCVVIIPQSSMTGKTKEETSIKLNILKKHTLEGVITLNKNTFYSVGTMPCIAVFTAGEPHPENKEVKFIDFRDDGYKVSAHIGLVETEQAKDRKQHLLDVWFNRIDSESKFCVKSTVEGTDEWLHSFYYFNDEIPTDEEFEKTIGEYLAFEFSMIMQNKEYLFPSIRSLENKKIEGLDEKKWDEFAIGELFEIKSGVRLTKENMLVGCRPFIGSTDSNNGITNFVSNTNESLDSNVLGVNYNGSVCEAFYHPYECVFSDDVKHLALRSYNGNMFIYLFFSRIIYKQKNKYTYGYKFNENRMKRQMILIPVNENNEPDYGFMEQYMINLMFKKYKQFRTYKSHHYRP